MNPASLAVVVIFDAIAGLICLAALGRIWSTPSSKWPHGVGSKFAWTAITLWLIVITGHLMWPFGAVLAIRKVRQDNRQALRAPAPLPFAPADYPWWNVTPTPTASAGNADAGEGRCITSEDDDDLIVVDDNGYDHDAAHRHFLEMVVNGEIICNYLTAEQAQLELAGTDTNTDEPDDPPTKERR